MLKLLVTVASLLLAVAPAAAQETRSAVPGQAPPPARLADLGWLVGTWEGEGITGPAREVYLPPVRGQMAGHFTQARGDAIWFYEIMTIVEVGNSLEYRLKHFNADLTGFGKPLDRGVWIRGYLAQGKLVPRKGEKFVVAP